MKRHLFHRPSPATAIACVALFVSLGGVSYGVATGSIDGREIADNTIRSKDVRNNGLLSRDLRNNDIRAIDIRNNTLRGRDIAPNTLTDDQIDESKLTQVPSALDADRLGGLGAGGYARSAQEPVRGIAQSDLLPGFAIHALTDFPPGFWKDSLGVVHLEGNIARTSGSGADAVFTLPAGYRPAGTARFAVAPPPEDVAPGGTTQIISITSAGVLIAADSLALDGITFRAAP